MDQKGLDINALPSGVREACLSLARSLQEILDGHLVALWVYGAATFPDRPARLGDVDTHAVIASAPEAGTTKRIDRKHNEIASNYGIEWDSWYVLVGDARLSTPPRHAFRDITDRAWALHRAHWLKGQFVLLFGSLPSEVVVPPSWVELEQGLKSELKFIDGIIEKGLDDAGHAAFAIWNGCRILYSFETHDVVVSKRRGATWALQNLPAEWRDAIEAAGRAYDAKEEPRDGDLLSDNFVPFVTFVHERFR